MTEKYDIEKIFEDQMKNNAGFRKFFEEHPEKKEAYIEKMSEEMYEVGGCASPNPVYCMTCVFAHGPAPFADQPNKANCEIYTRENGEDKPNDVYFDGAECEYYIKEEKK